MKLTDVPYDQYNAALAEIKDGLVEVDRNYLRVLVFNRVLEEELPFTTARRAYRTAIRVAMGQKNVPREFIPPKPRKSKKKTTIPATEKKVN